MVVMAGPESKSFLVDLTKQLDRFEKLTAGKGIKALIPDADDEETIDASGEDEEEDFAPKKGKAKKAAAAFDDDEEAEISTEAEDEADLEQPQAMEDDEDEDFTAAPGKKAAKGKVKVKTLTVDDVNDACKARCAAMGGSKGRAEVLAILKKKFKTESVSELNPEQYAACIAAMAVSQ